MTDEQLEAARQMHLAITMFSGVCFDPCEHDDCQFLLQAAKRWQDVDAPEHTRGHSRFGKDI